MLWFLINKEITRKGNPHGHDNKMTDQKCKKKKKELSTQNEN